MIKKTIYFFSLVAISVILSGSKPASSVLTSTASVIPIALSSEETGLNSSRLQRIDSIVYQCIKHKVFPGCQVLVLKNGKVAYQKSFGSFSYDCETKVNNETLYDLASLSKTTGTLLAIMKLYDNGLIKLSDKASDYLEFLKGTDKADITVEQLLFHESGLPASLPFHKLPLAPKSARGADAESSPTSIYRQELISTVPLSDFPYRLSDSIYLHKSMHQQAMQTIARARLRSGQYEYSCVNFILLKEIAEKLSGMPMDEFLRREFFDPMHLERLTYKPLDRFDRSQITPTLRKAYMRPGPAQGYVHDPDAAFFGGVAGNAGLFGNALDVAAVYQLLLNEGEFNGQKYLSPETCHLFTTRTSASGRRGLGFDKPTPSPGTCCKQAPKSVFGHTGYTGTCCWTDPENKLVYVFLSNRTYPNDGPNKLSSMRIRPLIQEVVYEAMK